MDWRDLDEEALALQRAQAEIDYLEAMIARDPSNREKARLFAIQLKEHAERAMRFV